MIAAEGHIGEININMDSVDFSMMVMGFAADIYHLCKVIPIDLEEPIKEIQTPVSPYWEMTNRVSMASHGYINSCLLPKVKIVEHTLRLYKNSKDRIIRTDPEGYLIGALKVFSDWKSKGIELEKKRHGENWGSKTAYNNWNPTEGLIE